MSHSIEGFISDLEGVSDAFEVGLVNSEFQTIQSAWQMAYDLSSGTLSYDDLRERDYPYALRHVSPQEDPTIINVHTGAFRGAWEIYSPALLGNIWITMLVNASRESDFLAIDTDRAFARPIDKRIEDALVPIREKNLTAALKVIFYPLER